FLAERGWRVHTSRRERGEGDGDERVAGQVQTEVNETMHGHAEETRERAERDGAIKRRWVGEPLAHALEQRVDKPDGQSDTDKTARSPEFQVVVVRLLRHERA